MTRRVYLAVVADPIARVLSAYVTAAGVILDRTAEAAESYAGLARWAACATRAAP